ncbi:GNAT family N-acetyltransferase [Nocardiopsis alba]
MLIRYAHADESAAVLLARVGYSAPVPASGGVVFVAEADGVTVGVLVGVLDGVGPCAPVPPPHGYVLAAAVAPGRRRRGIGRALLDRFVSEARSSGARWVFLFPRRATRLRAGSRSCVRPGSPRWKTPTRSTRPWGGGLRLVLRADPPLNGWGRCAIKGPTRSGAFFMQA